MKCLFRKHKFKHIWDQPIGALIFRHVRCVNCEAWWSLTVPMYKADRRHYKALRMKQDRRWGEL